jgi:hypothetical protein
MNEKRNACKLFVGKPERERPLGRARRRWVDNIITTLKMGVWIGHWIYLTLAAYNTYDYNS